LSVEVFYAVAWKRDVDYTALARLRWIEKQNMNTIAAELGIGRTAVIRYLGLIRQNPDLVRDGRIRTIIGSRKWRFMGGD
jgi:hypothetical protein